MEAATAEERTDSRAALTYRITSTTADPKRQDSHAVVGIVGVFILRVLDLGGAVPVDASCALDFLAPLTQELDAGTPLLIRRLHVCYYLCYCDTVGWNSFAPWKTY